MCLCARLWQEQNSALKGQTRQLIQLKVKGVLANSNSFFFSSFFNEQHPLSQYLRSCSSVFVWGLLAASEKNCYINTTVSPVWWQTWFPCEKVGGKSECFPSSLLKPFSSVPFFISPLCYFLPRNLLHLSLDSCSASLPPLSLLFLFLSAPSSGTAAWLINTARYRPSKNRTGPRKSSPEYIHMRCHTGEIIWWIFRSLCYTLTTEWMSGLAVILALQK